MKINIVGDITKDTFLKLDNKEAHLLCKLNSSNCEICFSYADKLPVDEINHAIGGNAANVSIALTKLGENPHLISQIGKDLDSKYLIEELKQEKVDISGIKMVETEKSNNSVIINYKGERTVLSFHEKRDYKLSLDNKADFVYLTSMGEKWQ